MTIFIQSLGAFSVRATKKFSTLHSSSLIFSGSLEKDIPVWASPSYPGFTLLGGDGFQPEQVEANDNKNELDYCPGQKLAPNSEENVPAYAVSLGASSIRVAME